MDTPVTEEQLKIALEPITREVNDLREDIKPLIEKAERAEKSYKYLFGNGEIGLDERVRNLEKQIANGAGFIKYLALAIGGYVLVEITKIALSHFGG